jgi:ABC-type uncharacterized transport system permease subunit
MTPAHRLAALLTCCFTGVAIAIWGHSLVLDIVFGGVFIAIGLSVADSICRRG